MEKNKMEVVVKIFKKIFFIGFISILCFVLTGCTNKEEIKSVEKIDDTSNIKLENIDKNDDDENNENKISQEDKNLSEHKNNGNSNDKINQTDNNIKQEEETEIKNTENNLGEVVKVTATEIDLDMHFIIVNGFDRNGNIIWTYETQREVSPQWSSIEYFGDHDGIVYLNELGTLKMLDFQTGKVLYTNSEYQGGPSINRIDGDGNIYLYAMTGDMFFVSDKKGNTIKKIQLAKYDDGTGLAWPFTDPVMDFMYDENTGDWENIQIKFTTVLDEEQGEKIKSTEYTKLLVINIKNYNVELKILDTKVVYY